ncbi:MAG: glycosyltransferase family 4 protein [Acidimicrobiales bacterium]
MRIGFDGTPLLGPKTGVGWYTHDLIDAIAAQSPDDELLVLPVTWRAAKLVSPWTHPNVHVVHRMAPARPLWALWERVPFPPVEWFLKCDVFHATNFIAPRSWRVPTVVTVHDIGFVRDPASVGPDILRMAELLPATLRRAAAVITVSQFTRDELASWLPEIAGRITVVPNASRRRPVGPPPGDGSDRPEPYVLMLGALNRRKNVGLLLDAFRILRDRGVDLRLVLAGPASDLLDLDELLAARGMGEPEVVRTGYVEDPEVARLLAGARVLAFPSLYEGFGMPLVEAMEAGVPVVGVRAGATPETVGDAGLLVAPGDAEGFADALVAAAYDEGVRTALIAAGRVQAATFSWDRAAAAVLDVYRSVVT